MAKNLNEFNTAVEIENTHLLQDELIQLSGIPTYYLKKSNVNLDRIFGEDNMMKYQDAVELYLLPDDPSMFGGSGDLFSKFGLEAIDTMVMFVEERRFLNTVGIPAPIEHDLVYIPIFGAWFEVTYVDVEGDNSDFFWNGHLSVYRIELLVYTYSHETIETGVEVVDDAVPTGDIQATKDNDVVDEYEKDNNLLDEFDKLMNGE